MKPTRFLTAAAAALLLSVAAGSTMAQTSGIPTEFASDPYVVQADAQLTAQGYTITSVTKDAEGNFTIVAVSAAGVERRVEIDVESGSVADTVDLGVDSTETEVADVAEVEDTAETEDSGDDNSSAGASTGSNGLGTGTSSDDSETDDGESESETDD